MALGIVFAGLGFWILFLVGRRLSDPPYWLAQSFTFLEFILIGSFLVYLATFSLELYRAHGKGGAVFA